MVFSVMIAWLRALTAVSIATCDLANHFHNAIGECRDRGRGADQHRPRSRLDIERVVLAVQVPDAPVGTVDLDHPTTLTAPQRGQPGTVGPVPSMPKVIFSPCCEHTGAAAHTRPIHRDRDLAEPSSELVQCHRHMGVLVRIDPRRRCAGDSSEGCSPLTACPSQSAWSRRGRAGGQDCDQTCCIRLLSGHGPLGRATRTHHPSQPTDQRQGTPRVDRNTGQTGSGDEGQSHSRSGWQPRDGFGLVDRPLDYIALLVGLGVEGGWSAAFDPGRRGCGSGRRAREYLCDASSPSVAADGPAGEGLVGEYSAGAGGGRPGRGGGSGSRPSVMRRPASRGGVRRLVTREIGHVPAQLIEDLHPRYRCPTSVDAGCLRFPVVVLPRQIPPRRPSTVRQNPR
jgi:hypothetical protein